MVGQVPSIRAPQYGQQASATMAQFDANAAQRRLAEAEALKGILSNAESAQNVFGGGALANLASIAGGVNPANFDRDYIAQSDYINQGQRNADVINTLAQASERMPDHIVNPGSFANGRLPQVGAPMTGHVDAGDRAAFANAQAIRDAALKARTDPDAMVMTITDKDGNTRTRLTDYDTYVQMKNDLAPDGYTVTLDPMNGGPQTNPTNTPATPLITGDPHDVRNPLPSETHQRTTTQPGTTQPPPADMTGGGDPIENNRQQFEKMVRQATNNPNATVTVEGNEYVVTDGAGKELIREKIE